MDLSPLNDVLSTIGDQGLDTFDTASIVDGQRLKGSGRQYVRFYIKKYKKPVTLTAKINPVTGSSTPLTFGMKEFVEEWVNVVTPGDKNEFDGPVEMHHKVEFSRHYLAFKQGKTAPLGKPLDECEYVPSHILIDLKYNGCHTEEQLADASDVLCGIIPNGFQLRDFAREVVKSDRENSTAPQVRALTAQNEELTKQLAEMNERLGAVEDGEIRRGPGRPRKIVEISE